MAAPQQGPSKEFAVAYRDMMLQGIGNEIQTTKKVIAAIPDNKKSYKPDEKARTAWELAWHIASVDVQFLEEIAEGKFSMEPRYKEEPKTVADLVSWYKNTARGLEKVRAMTPEQLVNVLNFYDAFHLPAFMYLSFVEKHAIHHRGALATYLRPMGAKVPSIYGGSADEPFQSAAA
jgi:uncharacterized damage-inducible protein DinB